MRQLNKVAMNISTRMQLFSRKRVALDSIRKSISSAHKISELTCIRLIRKHFKKNFWNHMNLIRFNLLTRAILSFHWSSLSTPWKLLSYETVNSPTRRMRFKLTWRRLENLKLKIRPLTKLKMRLKLKMRKNKNLHSKKNKTLSNLKIQ